jgi:hypothetical protein
MQHPTLRLLQDARSAMSTLVKNYNATATGIVGFGVGGGQALSAVASGTPTIEKEIISGRSVIETMEALRMSTKSRSKRWRCLL